MADILVPSATEAAQFLRAPKDGATPSEQAFIERLRQLGTGYRAQLKRNAGNVLGDARGVGWFWQYLDDEAREKNPEIPFLIATLFGLNKFNFTGDFGKSMSRLAGTANREAVERRFLVLLDAEFDRADGGRLAGGELAFRLRQMVKLAASKEIGVDWPQLLHDLRGWGYSGRPVQKRWAASFYPPPPPPVIDTPTAEPATPGS